MYADARYIDAVVVSKAVWYQGEADSSHPGGAADGYNCTFPAMIADWRSKWSASTNGLTNRTFPFGFVQLNSVGNAKAYTNATDPSNGDPYKPSPYGYAGLRWSQSAGYGYVPNPKMPNVFMAVCYDTPDVYVPYVCGHGAFFFPFPFLFFSFFLFSLFLSPSLASVARCLVYADGRFFYSGVMSYCHIMHRQGRTQTDLTIQADSMYTRHSSSLLLHGLQELVYR